MSQNSFLTRLLSPLAAGLLLAASAAQAAPVVLDLPAQPLADSLRQVAEAAGLTLAVDSALLKGRAAPALQGRMEAEDAIGSLLAGSGLSARNEQGTIVVQQTPAPKPGSSHASRAPEAVAELDTVKVIGTREALYAARQTKLGPFGDKPLLDTPYTVKVITQELLKNRQASTTMDALKNDAAVTIGTNGFNRGSLFSIRGFQVDVGSVKIDGQTTASFVSDLPNAFMDRVEVLSGTGGFLYGFGTPGGIVNYVLKRPLDERFADFSVGYTDDSVWRQSLDTGTRLNDGRVGLRLNALREEGDTNYGEARVRHSGVLGSMDVKITDAVQLDLNALYDDRRLFGDQFGISVSPGVEVPDPIPGDRRIAPDYFAFLPSQYSVGGRLGWQLSPTWSLQVDARQSRLRALRRDGLLLLGDDDGNYSVLQARLHEEQTLDSEQALLFGHFDTGWVRHSLSAGLSSRIDHNRYGLAEVGGVPTNLSAGVVTQGNLNESLPDSDDPGTVPQPTLANGYRYQFSREQALLLADTLEWSTQWQTVMGLRYVRFVQQNYGVPTAMGEPAPRLRDDKRYRFTPTVALIYKPIEKASVYASYAEALEQGATAGQPASNVGEVFGPRVSEQYELGAKTELGAALLSAALFRIDRVLTYIDEDNVFRQQGIQRHEGIEFSASGSFTPQWSFVGGGQWLHARIEEGDATLEGKKPPGVPTWQFNGYVEYVPARLAGIAVNLGANFNGHRAFDNQNTQTLGRYTTVDAGFRYGLPLGFQTTTLRFNVENLFDEKYFTTFTGNFLSVPQGRTFKASIETSF